MALTKYQTKYTQGVKINKTPVTNIVDRIMEAIPINGSLLKVMVDPVMADDILTINAGNRHVKHDTVSSYAHDMTEGKWLATGDPLQVTTEGKLINGQQRLLAVIKSGTTQEFDIKCGVPPESFATIDSGRMRTPGDTLSVEGSGDPNNAAAAIGFILSYQKFRKVSAQVDKKLIKSYMLTEWYRDENNRKRLIDCLSQAEKYFKDGRFLSKSMWAGIAFVLGKRSITESEAFLKHLATGADIGENNNSSIYHCRRFLSNFDKNKAGMGRRQFNFKKVNMVFTAWNYYRQKDGRGRPIRIEKLRVDNELELPTLR